MPRAIMGMNIFWGSGRNWKPLDAVAAWASEKRYYDRKNNRCANNQDFLHYTQMVWKQSLSVGCGKVICNSVDTFITCSYDPHGNVISQRPFWEKTFMALTGNLEFSFLWCSGGRKKVGTGAPLDQGYLFKLNIDLVRVTYLGLPKSESCSRFFSPIFLNIFCRGYHGTEPIAIGALLVKFDWVVLPLVAK